MSCNKPALSSNHFKNINYRNFLKLWRWLCLLDLCNTIIVMCVTLTLSEPCVYVSGSRFEICFLCKIWTHRNCLSIVLNWFILKNIIYINTQYKYNLYQFKIHKIASANVGKLENLVHNWARIALILHINALSVRS